MFGSGLTVRFEKCVGDDAKAFAMVFAWQEGFDGVEYFSGFGVHETAGLQQEPEADLVCVLNGFNP